MLGNPWLAPERVGPLKEGGTVMTESQLQNGKCMEGCHWRRLTSVICKPLLLPCITSSPFSSEDQDWLG